MLRKMLDDFRAFALRGNVIDMAIGIIIGGAFGAITKSLVDDVIMPPIGLLIGGVDFGDLFVVLRDGPEVAAPYASLEDARTAGAVVIAYGRLVNSLISFLLVALAAFMVVRAMLNVQRRFEKPKPAAAPATKECPFCAEAVPLKATRCGHCTSQLA